MYLVKCGCPWRYRPADFPHWKTVYHVFRQWIDNHQWAVLNDTLRILIRKSQGKRSRPTAASLDSQSVKSAGHGGRVGYDAGKRIKGLRPQLAVTIVKRSNAIAGFKILPRRWVVERTFGWLMLQRRLGRDYETTESSAEAWIYIAMIQIQLPPTRFDPLSFMIIQTDSKKTIVE